MFTKTNKLSFSAIAFAIGASTLGQFPARYDHAGLVDDALAIAVDRRGNTYVVGKVMTTSGTGQKYNALVHSYDFLGNARANWPKSYNGPGNGDDIATSIHVTYDGSVIVAGTSYGGSTSGFDYFAIKYDTNGNPLWPTSGSAGTGAIYHNGAVRTHQSSGGIDEGAADDGNTLGVAATAVHVSMAVRDDPSLENQVIAITGIKAFFVQAFSPHKWRTFVFEPDEEDEYNPKVKNGWPVEHTQGGTTHDEVPRAVAIHTDNTVYITGSTSAEGGTEDPTFFTTLRYAAGGSTASPVIIWKHDWSEGAIKPNSGMDIKLDRDGNAYATGIITQSETLRDYGTVHIPRDWDEDPLDIDTHLWDNGETIDEAVSISLTYEKVSSTMKVFAYVTGSTGGNPKDIATIRYEDDLDPVWSPVAEVWQGASNTDDTAFMVVGAGDGNAYVIGRTGAGSAGNFVIIGYDQTGAERFTPDVYSNTGEDEGHAIVMGFAGLPRATGKSTGSGTSFDYLTLKYEQSVTTIAPSSFTVAVGTNTSGGLAQLSSSDNAYMVIAEGLPFSRAGDTVDVAYSGTSPVNDPSEICITIEGKASHSGIELEVMLKDRLTGQWPVIDTRNLSTSDSALILVIKDDPERFVDSSSGAYELRITGREVEQDWSSYSISVDMLVVSFLQT